MSTKHTTLEYYTIDQCSKITSLSCHSWRFIGGSTLSPPGGVFRFRSFIWAWPTGLGTTMISSSELSLIRFKPPRMILFLIRVHNTVIYRSPRRCPTQGGASTLGVSPSGISVVTYFQSTYQNIVSNAHFFNDFSKKKNEVRKWHRVWVTWPKKSCDHQMCLFSKQLIAQIDIFAIAACSIIKLFLLTCLSLFLIFPYWWHLIGDRNGDRTCQHFLKFI